MQVSILSISISVTSGSALMNCFSPAFPKARDTASIPDTRVTPLTHRITPPRSRKREISVGQVGRWSTVSKTISPSRLTNVARESPTFATNKRGGRIRSTTAVDPGPGLDDSGFLFGFSSVAAWSHVAKERFRAPTGSDKRVGSWSIVCERFSMR